MTVVGMSRQPARSVASHNPYDDEAAVEVDELLADWARERVLNHEGVGVEATAQERAAYGRAMMLYHGTQGWESVDRERYASKRARELGYPDSIVGADIVDLAEARP